MNYKSLYDELYEKGYQNNVNIGAQFVDFLCNNYDFESVLDVGCSQGKSLELYKKRGKRVFGVDIAEKAIEICKAKGLINCEVASAMILPFKRSSIDAVVTTDVLEHLAKDDILKAIWSICRVTRKWVFIKVSTGKEGVKEWIDGLHEEGKFLDVKNLHLTVWTWDKWIDTIEKNSHLKFIEKKGKLLIFRKEE